MGFIVDEKPVLVVLSFFASGIDTPHFYNSYKVKGNKMSSTATQHIPTGFLIFPLFGSM